MIDPAKVCLFIPGHLKKFKLDLFERIGRKIVAAGGRVVNSEFAALDGLPDAIIPIVGCTPELRPFIDAWSMRGRAFIYWDRGYCRRVFATHLPRGESGGYYRWHCNSFQMQAVNNVPDNRWEVLRQPLTPWVKNGKHIVVALPTETYSRFHNIVGWTDKTLRALARMTSRQIVVRDKESKRTLQDDLDGAYCLVAHGSNAAVEAAIMGCPVFVDPCSAAALVGLTDLTKIETPVYPSRERWAHSLAYSQFNENELVNGTLWRLLS